MISKLLTIAFVLAIGVRVGCHIILDDEIFSSASPPCVRDIAERHFVPEGEIVVVSDGPTDRVSDFEGMLQVILTISEAHDLIRSEGLTRGIIFLEGKFKRDLPVLKCLVKFDARSRVVIVINGAKGNVSGKSKYLMKVFRYLDENNHGLLVVVAVESKSGSVALYRHVGRIHKNCSVDTVEKIGNCSAKTIDGLFSWKINYQRCPLKMGYYNPQSMTKVFEDGTDRNNPKDMESAIVDLIIDRLNATPKMISIPTRQSIRKMISNDELEMAWGQIVMTNSDNMPYYYTRGYVFDKGVVIYHEQKSFGIGYWFLSTFTPLGIKVWIGIGLVVLLHVILKRLTGGFGEISFLNLVAVCLGISYPGRPRRLSSRIFYASWIIFGYVLTQCYLANLAMTFITMEEKPAFLTIDDLEKSKIKIGGPAKMRSPFEEKWPRLYREYNVMNFSEYWKAVKDIQNGRSELALSSLYYGYNYHKWINLSWVPEKIMYYPVGLLLNNASLIGPTCNHVIDGLMESGIIRYFTTKLDRPMKQPAKVQTSDDRIDFNEFFAIFLKVYVTGCICACVVFIIELLVSFYSQKINSRTRSMRPKSRRFGRN